MDTALPQKFPFILDRNLAKANCREDRVCTYCDTVVLVSEVNYPLQVSERLGLLYSEMIFCRGYVHSDPHPGNVLVRNTAADGAQIILLDHGLYAVRPN